MGKLLKTKDILLLGLSNVLDAVEEIKDPLHLVSFSYKNMYGWVPKKYRRYNFHQLVSRTLKAKLIEKIEKNGEVYMRITSEGKRIIQRDFPMLSFQNKAWDGKWRISMFDIEEINKTVRDRLRRKLKELGFGMLQKSVFISPHDIMRDFLEFSESAGIKDNLYFLETDNLIVGDRREFANKIWRLNELNESYKEIVDEIKNRYMISQSDRAEKLYTQKGNQGNQLSKDAVKVRSKWLNILIADPFLPKNLLPKPWWGDEARKLVKSLSV